MTYPGTKWSHRYVFIRALVNQWPSGYGDWWTVENDRQMVITHAHRHHWGIRQCTQPHHGATNENKLDRPIDWEMLFHIANRRNGPDVRSHPALRFANCTASICMQLCAFQSKFNLPFFGTMQWWGRSQATWLSMALIYMRNIPWLSPVAQNSYQYSHFCSAH